MATAGDTERRRRDRTAVELPAQIVRVGGRALNGQASTVDLSEGGARLLGPADFRVGDVVVVTISGGDVTIAQQALVVGRQAAGAGTAKLNLAFKTLGGTGAAQVLRLIASRSDSA